jgi:hypothetical protein
MRKNVAVSLQRPGSGKIRIVGRFYRLRSAELFIERRMKRDPEGVARGDYGIDAPECIVNKPRRKR